ncbi:MAG: magnesium transporter [Elusimicrobia bacterium]|nr:magnesium transporter [Elusimicrobiota bacterium]
MRGHEPVAGHLVRSALRARPDESAAAVLARLAAEKPASVELVLVVDHDGRLTGAVPLAKLLALEPGRPLSEAAEEGFPRTTADADQERAASLALHRGVDALPVVDAKGRPLGVMPAQALLQVLRREHVEDLHLLAGIQREGAQARHAIEDPPMRRVRHRLPWLLVGLAGSSVATAAMAAMEETLRANIKIVFFVPALVYLADAVGTQTETVAVRGLSLTRAGLAPLLAAELRTGMLLGAILGGISIAPIWLWSGDIRLASAVAASIFAAGTVANGLGLLFPWTLKTLGFDPAYGTGPASTVVQDVCTILVYFAIVSAFGL